MTPVTDPDLLAQLNADDGGAAGTEVTDPDLLAQLNAEEAPISPQDAAKLRATNIARAIAGGATMQFADEGEAGVRAAITGENYKDVLDRIRKEYARYHGEHPGEATGLELASGIGSAFIPGVGLGSKTVQGITGLSKIANPILRAGASGAIEGGLTALGSAEDKFSDLADTTGKVLGGALLGGGLGAGLSAIPGVARGALNIFNRPPTEAAARRKAMDIVAQAMERDRMGPFDIYAQSAGARAVDVPTNLSDLGGPNTLKLTETVLGQPSQEGGMLARELAALQKGARGRVEQRVSEGVAQGADYDVARTGVVQRLRDTFENAYKPAYAVGVVNDPLINRLINSESVAPYWGDVMRTVRAQADNLGVRVEDLMPMKFEAVRDAGGNILADATTGAPMLRPTGESAPTVEALDMLKKAMDEGIDARFRAGGVSPSQADALRGIRKQVVDTLDNIVPEYRAARRAYAGDAEVRTAYDIGMGVNLPKGAVSIERMRPQQLAHFLEDMSAAEQEGLRVGYGNKLMDDLTKSARNQDWAGNIIENPQRAEKLKLMYPDPDEYALFEQALRRESRLYQNRGKVLGGAATAGRLAAKADFDSAIDNGNWQDVASMIVNGKSGNILGAAQAVMRMMRGQNYGTEVYNQVARLLRNGTPEEIAETLRRMSISSTERAARTIRNEGITRNVATGAAGALATTPPSSGEEPAFPELTSLGVEGASIGDTLAAGRPTEMPETSDLTARQIQVESGGDPNAVSPKGAAGLMQLMPATAAKPGFGVEPARDDSTAENVRVGQEYTQAFLDKYNGNKALALTAYNMGPGATDKWLANGADPAKLPRETREYVQKILGADIWSSGRGIAFEDLKGRPLNFNRK